MQARLPFKVFQEPHLQDCSSTGIGKPPVLEMLLQIRHLHHICGHSKVVVVTLSQTFKTQVHHLASNSITLHLTAMHLFALSLPLTSSMRVRDASGSFAAHCSVGFGPKLPRAHPTRTVDSTHIEAGARRRGEVALHHPVIIASGGPK